MKRTSWHSRLLGTVTNQPPSTRSQEVPTSYPPITAQHIAADAHLYANRVDMVRELGRVRSFQAVAEIGVAFGDFTEIILDALNPSDFVAFDLFKLHELPMIWGKLTAETLGRTTPLEFYVERFRRRPVRTVGGDSSLMLGEFPDGCFDLIYVDGDHSYKGVKADSILADKKRIKNELRVCAARSRRRNSVGRTRGVADRRTLWRFQQDRRMSERIAAACPSRSARWGGGMTAGGGAFEPNGAVIWAKVRSVGCIADMGPR